jgi:adenylate kinase family enzyme
MQRINVVGTSCAGKTTLARAIADRLDLPHTELDALFWGRDWTPVPVAEFRERVVRALAGQAWIADGGYEVARDIIWGRADTVIWLDYSLRVVMSRYARRTTHRLHTGEEFWPGTGNRESLRNVLRRDGLLWWILRTHRGKRQRMQARMSRRTDLRWIRLTSPDETSRWLRDL